MSKPSIFSNPVAPQHAWQPPTLDEMRSQLPGFRFEELIGRGGMGSVYKAVQISLGRTVAIKVLPADLMDDADALFGERFEQEARLVAKFSHPHIVSVYESGKTTGGLLYMVMEYVEGTDLAGVIRSSGKLAPTSAVDFAMQICQALACAHRQGVIHRDIKPGNVLITKDVIAKVADFGLAKQFDGSQLGLTKSAVTVGTPDFLAPEAWMPGSLLDGRTDLYSLGVVFYQMLTGEVPRGLWKMPSVLVGTDVCYDAIIDRAMQPDREARYATAELFLHDLGNVRAAAPLPEVKRPPYRPVIAFVAVLALAIISAGILWPRGRYRTIVTTTNPAGPGCLMEAIDRARKNPGADVITFAPSLAGKEIPIPVHELIKRDGDGEGTAGSILFDASGLAGGVVFAPTQGNIYLGIEATVEIRNVHFKGGKAEYGGIISNRTNLTLQDCTFSGNVAKMSGGAIFNEGNLTLLRCSFQDNSCASNGGAVFTRGQLTMTDCTLSGNKVGTGGGAIACDGGRSVLTRCTIQGNEAGRQGGGVLCNSGEVLLTHCTVSGNKVNGPASSHGGGGICFADTVNLRMDSCIVAGNEAVSGKGPDLWAQASPPLAVRCLIGNGNHASLVNGTEGNLVGTSTMPLDARLSPLGDYGGGLLTMPPREGSPVIDAAAGSAAKLDQRALPITGAPDIGAVEFQR